MKLTLHFILIFVFSFSAVKAQSPDAVSELTPVPSNLGKFSKRLPVDKNRVSKEDNFKFEVKAESKNLSDQRNAVGVIIKLPYEELTFENIAGKWRAKAGIYARITSDDKITDGFFEEILTESTDTDGLLDAKNKYAILNKTFELPKGNYQIGVIVRDLITGRRGVKVIKFQIA